MVWTQFTDARCCYKVLGHGEPLLLVPGLGVTCNVWDPALPELAAHFSPILIDNRGIGHSQSLRRPETLRHFVSDLIELLDHLQVDRAHVMGLSLGGIIARRLAVDHPSRVDRLVLISCSDRFTPYLTEVMKLLGNMLRGLSIEAFARVMETLGSSPEFFDSHVALIDQRVRDKCEGSRLAIGRQLACLATEVCACHERETVTAPTLVLSGQYDALIPSCYGRAMAERIADAQFEMIDGAGHNLLLECPQRVVPRIIQFLKSGESKPGQQWPKFCNQSEEGREVAAND